VLKYSIKSYVELSHPSTPTLLLRLWTRSVKELCITARDHVSRDYWWTRFR